MSPFIKELLNKVLLGLWVPSVQLSVVIISLTARDLIQTLPEKKKQKENKRKRERGKEREPARGAERIISLHRSPMLRSFNASVN